MTMSATEKKVIANLIRRLRCKESPKHTSGFGKPSYGESADIRYALCGSIDPDRILSDEDAEREVRHLPEYWRDAARRERFEGGVRRSYPRIYLESWVIGALEALLDEEDGGTGRDPQLALDLSR